MQARFPACRATALAATLAALTLGFAGSAPATEGGGTTAAAGAEGFLAGALPPPGTYGLVYATHYQASRVNDNDGHSAVPGFKVKADVVVSRLVHMTSTTLLGGQLGYYGVLPLVKLNVKAAGMSDSRTGAGDIEAAPLLAWHGPQWHTGAALALVLPTGSYDAGRMANPGNNITTIRPVFVASYLTESGLDVSTKLSYSINRKNSDTNYQSGQYLHADFNVGTRVAPGWQVGLQGYLIHQTTDDKVNGVKVGPDGNRTRVFAFGPGVRWQSSPTAPSVELRWLKETGARNHTQGNAVWLKAVWAL